MHTLEKNYHSATIETPCYHFWEKQHYFTPNLQGAPFCTMLPPPNITGSLHLGHACGFSYIDVITRKARMEGHSTLWQGGTDHAGIATQMVVERQLLTQGKTKQTLGREEFIACVWQWKKQSDHRITHQLRRLGASIDWQRECFTMDPAFSQAVQTVFITLYQQGLIYKGKRLVNWDPVFQTALSDLEVIHQEEMGSLWYIRYPLVTQPQEYLTVATTRPETLFGDMAVAVHPDDERYQRYIGQQVTLPLTGRMIPVIADQTIDPTFGTGCVKITPGSDFNDYAIGLRHHLTPITIFTPDGSLNHTVPAPFRGLTRCAARKQLVQVLDGLGLLAKTVSHLISVPHGDRSGATIEPYLTDQWYLKTKPLAEPAMAAVRNGDVKFIPHGWQKTFFQWMEHIEDWCISRQLWWGHRIPIWYDQDGNAYAGQHALDVKERYHLSAETTLTQEEDVLDTWFSSALWPFVTLGWPKSTDELKRFFPTQVLITGFDILFFWVARMIMMSLKFTQNIPFQTVYITGLIRDAEGQKMSKTKGNVLDPLDLIDGITLDALIHKRTQGMSDAEQTKHIAEATRREFPAGIPAYGTDALRLTFCALAPTRDLRFDMHRLAGYHHFCNKLWHAARYVMMNLQPHQTTTPATRAINPTSSSPLPNRWIISKLQQVIAAAHQHFTHYRFDLLTQTLYDFTWNEFCAWYIEFSKHLLTLPADHSESTAVDHATTVKWLTQYILVTVLETILRLWHPIIPFITETLWQALHPFLAAMGCPAKTASIMIADYPIAIATHVNAAAEHSMAIIQATVTAIRTKRSEMNIPPTAKLQAYIRTLPTHAAYTDEQLYWICQLAKLSAIEPIAPHDLTPTTTIAVIVPQAEIFLQVNQQLDQHQEILRLQKTLKELQENKHRLEYKLKDTQFLTKAPAAIIEKTKHRQTALQDTITKLQQQLAALHCMLE